ncbi:MAG: mycothione reductase [Acidimicrobiia bacterium]|nr:mycothione reductase [Acidimicrobiia bacterium]MXY74061.1 mycothione reductase [Acidimicrobiia bacterium]MYA39790.1 mycothione reductase [Acidimicrobiia bacterium]MYH06249.1 mycothione reductase [Acidimicrobiia bacterium]MYK56851.1 mycothione reductase [Acidimicrobiia bacterium]
MRNFDLMIIGTGSGNSVIGPEHDGWEIAVVERGPFGGTCLNVGCIPSKMFVYAAEMAELASDSDRLGVHTRFEGADWPAIRDRIFGRIDPIAAGGRSYREGLPNVTVYTGSGRFTGHKEVAVGDEVITADRIVIAVGGRPTLPPAPGLAECGYQTSDTVMRLDELPDRLLVIGAGYIAAELGGVMGAFGSTVTFLLRGDTFLRREDHDISSRFTAAYSRRFDVRTHTRILGARRENGEVVISLEGPEGESSELWGDELLVATGRRPNSDQLDVEAGGIEIDSRGFVVTDEQLRTSAEGVWALGDITNPVQLKHVANHEARVVRHNLTDPDIPATVDHRFIPHAVFGYPQIASVGLTEQECRRRDIPYVSHVQPYAAAAYGWAMEDTDSVAKVIAHAETRRLLGAHIIGPQAPTLIQQLIQGMHFDLTVDQMARGQYYIHPALPEVIEQALLEL